MNGIALGGDIMAKENTASSQKEYRYIRKSFRFDGELYAVYGKTEKEAKTKMAKLRRDLEAGIAVKQHSGSAAVKAVTGDYTVEKYSALWLSTYIKPKIRKPGSDKQKNTISQKSYNMYVQKLNGCILPAIGQMKLKDVTDTNLQQILNGEKERGMSKSHCSKVKIVINAMFHQAVKSRLIPYNPAEDLVVTAENGTGRRSITAYEREILLDVAATHRCGLWVRFLLSTGVRPAESAPLQIKDLDFDNNLISIYKPIESGTENVIGPPKSAAGIRHIPIRDDIRETLLDATKDREPESFVFPQMDGKTMMTTTAMSNNWRSFARQMDLKMGAKTTAHGHIYDPKDLDKHGVPLYPDENGEPRNGHKIAPDLVPYCLRHTACTDMQKAGVPLNIAKVIMGHEDIKITAAIYTHTDCKDVQIAGKMLNDAAKKAKAE